MPTAEDTSGRIWHSPYDEALRDALPDRLEGSAVLEIGVGAGTVLRSVLDRGAARAVGVEVSAEIAQVAWNAVGDASDAEIRVGDGFEPLRAGERFDLILANPPTFPDSCVSPVWTKGGPTGREVLTMICTGALQHLVPRGSLLIVTSTLFQPGMTLRLLADSGLIGTVVFRREVPLRDFYFNSGVDLSAAGRLGPVPSETLLVIEGLYRG